MRQARISVWGRWYNPPAESCFVRDPHPVRDGDDDLEVVDEPLSVPVALDDVTRCHERDAARVIGAALTDGGRRAACSSHDGAQLEVVLQARTQPGHLVAALNGDVTWNVRPVGRAPQPCSGCRVPPPHKRVRYCQPVASAGPPVHSVTSSVAAPSLNMTRLGAGDELPQATVGLGAAVAAGSVVAVGLTAVVAVAYVYCTANFPLGRLHLKRSESTSPIPGNGNSPPLRCSVGSGAQSRRKPHKQLCHSSREVGTPYAEAQ